MHTLYVTNAKDLVSKELRERERERAREREKENEWERCVDRKRKKEREREREREYVEWRDEDRGGANGNKYPSFCQFGKYRKNQW